MMSLKQFLLFSLLHYSLSSLVILGIKKNEFDYYFITTQLSLLNYKSVSPNTLISGYICEQNTHSDCFSNSFENIVLIKDKSFLEGLNFTLISNTKSIIINIDSLNNTPDIIQNINIPIYAVSNKTYSQLDIYNNEVKSFTSIIVYIPKYSYFNSKYLFIASIICTFLYLILILWWLSYSCRSLYNENPNPLHKGLRIFPFVKLVISLYSNLNLYLIFGKEILNKVDKSNITENFHTDILFYEYFSVSFQMIFQVIQWFTIILISYGWYILKENLSRKDKSQFVVICVLIILSFSFDIDQILDYKIIYPLLPSDLRGIIIGLFITIISVFKSRKAIQILEFIATSFEMFSRENSITFLKKKRMIQAHRFLIIINFMISTLIVLIGKVFLHDIDNSTFIAFIITQYWDFLFISIYLPRKLIFNSIISFLSDNASDNIANEYNIFKISLPSNKEIYQTSKYNNCMNKNGLEMVNNNVPILIINPFSDNNMGNYSFNIIDKVSIGL